MIPAVDTNIETFQQQSVRGIFSRTNEQHLSDLSELSNILLALPSNDDATLFEKVVERVFENSELQKDLLSIRRWHAYYKFQDNRDMNGIGHAVNTVQITNQLGNVDLASGVLNPEELSALILTAFIHDFGEIYLGNATYGGKSESHEKKEIIAFRNNIPKFFPDFSTQDQARLEQLYLDVAMNKDMNNKLAAYFNMVEVTGYVTFGAEAFADKSPLFQWEVLGWRILRYHLFRDNKDLPIHIEKSEGARAYWSQKIDQLDQMVQHFKNIDQNLFLSTYYRRTALPDCDTVKPIDFASWDELRFRIVAPKH